MKNTTSRFVLLCSIWLLGQIALSAQTSMATIIGPDTLCVGDCALYKVVLADPGIGIAQVSWGDGSGNVIGDEIEITYCPTPLGPPPGFATLNVQGFTTNQTQFFDDITIFLTTTVNPVIVSTSSLCPDSTSTCDRICAFGTATYEATGIPAGTPVTWEVLGAQNFTPNGNSVTVEWGAPGQGQVTVTAGTSAPLTKPLQIYCGMWDFTQLPNGGLGGDGYVTIHGGTAPYDITVAGSSGTVNLVSNGGNTIIPGLEPGQYSVTVTDADGTVKTCDFTIASTDADCWASIYPTSIVHSPSCDTCDGQITLATTGIGLAYTFIWSNGSTTKDQTGLCPGIYTITLTDDLGCSSTETFEIICPPAAGCSGSSSLCVEILKEPQAAIGSLPPAANGVIEICQGQTVYFKNQSQNASSYIWDFGDLNTSAQFEPSHTYTTPGTYTVSLIARNACYCNDTTFVTVEVLAADVPSINCTGTVCEGETVTYSTDASCGMYNWAITGSGSILDGGGPTDNFITVQWNAGPEGAVSLDVSGCAGNVCNSPNVVPIPIISDNAQIQGPDKVCEGSTEEYFIPDYAGTEITWTVLGTGNITSGQGTERITVNWFGDANVGNPQRVIVEFTNCYLGCQGKDTLDVFIVPGFYTTGPIEVCQNTSATYRSFNTITGSLINANWQVFNATGTSVWTSGAAANTANIPFNFPSGSYTVRATAANATGFCNQTYDIFVKLVGAPPQPTGILGAQEICPGTTYSYEAQGLLNTDFTWTFTGGTPSTFHGNPANVVWGAAPPYSVSVVQTATTGLACTSAPLTLTVNPVSNFTLSGDAQVCREATGSYSAPAFENLNYAWTISPADAGTITSGQGSAAISVLWHSDGPATVNVSVCGSNQNFNVTVLPLPEPVVPAADVCFGETTTVTTTTPYAGYVWENASGAQVSTDPMPSLGGGTYQVVVTDADGCVGDTTFFIDENPLPNVSISTPSYYALCSGGPAATIYALTTGAGYDYEWTQDGNPVGGNTPTYSTTTPGTYQVQVTDVNGCTALSNPLTLVDCAAIGGTCVGGLCYGGAGGPPVPGGGCTPAGTVDFNPVTTMDCNTVDFVNTSTNFVPGSFNWYFDDPASGAANTSNLQDPSHTFTAPGYYTVILIGEVNASSPPGATCGMGIFKDVLVPAVADFDYEEPCPGAPAAFTDLSAVVAGASITAWDWDFGDPGSGPANTSTLTNPAHTFANPGSYTVTLTVTEASGCQVSVSKTVTVLDPPTVNFTLPTLSCEGTALLFTENASADATSFAWNFGDPGSGAANASTQANAAHVFGAAGNYTVTLTASNIYGCMASHSEMFNVDPNTLSGNISYSQPPPICEGESITLTAPPGGISWNWTTGAVANNITTFESGVYGVTLTDALGCKYSPPPAPVDVIAEPNGIIKGVEVNEYGQPVAFFENNYSVCDGEDVTLIIQGSTGYSYVWSNGEPGNEISFTDDKGNLLPVGTHNFTVTVTDGTSGCTSVEGPFTVTVNPKPSVAIESMPTGFLCENMAATLSVTSPDPMLTYSWNTGETGTSITVIAGGTYFTQATNQFGCRSRSNQIVLNNAPDIGKIPTGCHSRCEPDTMCLPNLPNVASYQWYLDGNPMAGPNGTQANPIFDQSGEYFVEMTDIYGCSSTSEVLTLDLFPGFGDILGNVWFDVNQNGIIDGPDTLVSGIQIFLNDGSVNLDTVASGAGGSYVFPGILASNYNLELDTSNLPTGWGAYFVNTNLDLIGCDVEEEFDWLLFDLCSGPDSTQLELFACPDSTVTYGGQPLSPGMSQDFTFQNLLGCDSVVQVSVSAFQTTFLVIDAFACEGSFFDYNGTQIPAGSSQIFTQTNADGCLDTTIVGVMSIPADASSLTLAACGNASVTYQGQQLFPGDVMDFTLMNTFGCDSVVTVTVVGSQVDTTALALQVCEGETISYNGQQLAAGDQQDFIFQNQNGCDSVVQVSVTNFPPVSFDLAADEICWNASDGAVTVENLSGGATPYLFSLDSTTWQPDSVFDALAAGSYTVFVQDGNDCVFEKNISLTPIPPISVETQDATLTCGDSVQLAPIAFSQLPLTWEWSSGSAAQTIWVKSPGTYTLKLTNDCETVERVIEVAMEPVATANLIYMPNSFSPNFDGINDCFRGYVSPRVDLQHFTLKIFDRWGDMMFETNDPNECWDGHRKGEPMDPAVFVWFIEMRILSCDGQLLEVFKEGGVHLMK